MEDDYIEGNFPGKNIHSQAQTDNSCNYDERQRVRQP